MQIFKTRAFARFAHKEAIPDEDLREAVARAEQGLVDAPLGADLIKQRVARTGGGRSGDFRTIVVYRVATLAVFIHGYGKNEKDNVNAKELAALKMLAREFKSYGGQQLKVAVESGELIEVKDEEAIQ